MNVNPSGQVVLGLGSLNGDDQFGWCVIDALLRSPIAVELHKIRHPIDILFWLDLASHVHVVDAAIGLPEHVCLWRLEGANPEHRNQIQMLPSHGTHDWGLSTTYRMAQSLGKPIERVTLWLGRAEAFQPQMAIGVDTQTALDVCLETLRKQLG
ncbi:hypothetical protein Pla52o_33240 [Novipirellula galeiformis]|uniref:Hydrogenase maturation protease n=1 Tax=Novipirellula galeiformis TaxID=2528004 RepID=A0A5C6CDF2_9BACT|nr:hypothetical protein [Novipirellula galeiformis]TWU22268.1 hypothetical protein Pla52o_33240 [Novipirellula galeiformis]